MSKTSRKDLNDVYRTWGRTRRKSNIWQSSKNAHCSLLKGQCRRILDPRFFLSHDSYSSGGLLIHMLKYFCIWSLFRQDTGISMWKIPMFSLTSSVIKTRRWFLNLKKLGIRLRSVIDTAEWNSMVSLILFFLWHREVRAVFVIMTSGCF